MAKRTFGKQLLGGFAKFGTTLEFGDVKILVRSASVKTAQAFQAAQVAFRDKADSDALNDQVIEVFMGHACDPDTGELAFGPEDRDAVVASIPMPVVLKVVQAAVGIDVEAAAKN